MLRPILGITMGDAAGGGPEVIVKALADAEIYRIARPLVYGDAKMMERAVHIVGAKVHCHAVERPADGHYEEGTIDVVDLANLPADLPFAQVDGRAGRAAYEYIERACADAMHRSIHAIVTAPLNKEALHLGGLNYPGHTEILGSLMGLPKYSMMLTSPKLRVIHVTTHIALHDVPGRVKEERIADVIALAQETLQLMGIERPRIAVAGLNPHCGEGGLFGDEDEREIVPAVREAQEMKLVGFIIMSILYVYLQVWVLTPPEKRTKRMHTIAGGLAVFFSVSLYFVFTKYLMVMLPPGILK